MTVKHMLFYLAVAVAIGANVKALSLNDGSGVTRRDALIGGSVAAFGLTTGGLYLPNPAFAGDEGAPIAVVGASGRTGALCVASCLRRGVPVRALTRSGEWPPKKVDLKAVDFDGDSTPANELLTISACDVKDASSLAAAVSGCRGVIYAASASRKGGNSNEIDNLGVASVGDACLQANVARYVILSSTAVTRPNSMGYKFTEMVVAGVMGAKRGGEVAVRDAYAKAKGSSSYTVIRPGGT